ncbi:MAG: hypothetical protein ACJ75I_01150 [Solirubrobacterales bacterium]
MDEPRQNRHVVQLADGTRLILAKNLAIQRLMRKVLGPYRVKSAGQGVLEVEVDL